MSKDLNDIILENTKKILKKYKNDKEVIVYFNQLIEEQIPKFLDAYKESTKKKELKEHNRKQFIHKFLTDDSCMYYYIYGSDLFINYNRVDYTRVSESDIICNISDKMNGDPVLMEHKMSIDEEIITMLKIHKLETTIPETETIQKLLGYFWPLFFKTKQEAKYFFCVLGDIFLNKKRENIYYVVESARPFIEYLDDLLSDYFKHSFPRLTDRFKFHYRNHEYNKSRIIYFDNDIGNLIMSWKTMLNENIFNIYAVSCHYSNRYRDSDQFLLKQRVEMRIKIRYLVGNDKISIVNEFSENMLIFGDDYKMSTNNMKLLWKIYLNKRKMPEIMFKREIIDIMKLKCNMTGNMFVGVRWNMCSVDFDYFKEFWSSKITHNIEIDDSYEISEIHDLFGQWIVKTKNKPHVFSEEDVLYIIKFICNDIKIVNDKNVENVVCKMWNKKESLFDILPKMLKNKELHYDITIVNAYKEYVKYLGDQDTNIVSKRYFERYIQKIVPPQYIDSVNNLIRKEFWI